MNLPTIQKIETKNLTWINVTKTGEKEIEYLGKTFKFHPIHLADCLSPAQRPKLDVTQDYIFMVLVFPIYKRRKRRLIASEVDFFISQNRLITVHNNELAPLINFFNICQISESQRAKYFTGNPMLIVYEILTRLFAYCSPILDNLQIAVNNIERNIFRGYERRMVKEILIIKRNIVNFRRIMQVHRTIIRKLITQGERFFSTVQIKLYFKSLSETTSEIWDNLENLKESINALEDTNSSLISFRLNDIMKILTIISVTVLPITLISSIFGMNFKYMPWRNDPLGFWIVIGIIALSFLSLFISFKRKKWI